MPPKPYDPLDPQRVAAAVRNHWRDSDPFLARRLTRAGTLAATSQEVAQQVIDFATSLQGQGMDPYQALSEAMREVDLQPQGVDVKPQGNDRMPPGDRLIAPE